MTKNEAVKYLESLKTICQDAEEWADFSKECEALNIAIAALRGPTREHVKALPKCNYCEAEWGTCDPITNRFTMPLRGGIRFCPMCGRPLTDEAVDIIMQRLEMLKCD